MLAYVLINTKRSVTHLCQSASEVYPIRLRLARKLYKHTRIQPRASCACIRNGASAAPQRCTPSHSTPASRSIQHRQQLRPTIPTPPPPQLAAPAEFQRTRARPEELLVDSCFDQGDGEAVGYEDVSMSLCGWTRATSGNDGGRDPMLTLTFRSLRLRGRSQGVSRACMMRVQIENIVYLGNHDRRTPTAPTECGSVYSAFIYVIDVNRTPVKDVGNHAPLLSRNRSG